MRALTGLVSTTFSATASPRIWELTVSSPLSWRLAPEQVTGCQLEHPAITHVKVLDPDFKTICVITDNTVLEELIQIWTERTTVEPSPDHKFTHKVDFSTGEKGTRWLYDPSGYATALSKEQMPIYRFTNPDKLKAILIPQQAESTVR